MEYRTLKNGIVLPAIGFGPGICGYSARYRPMLHPAAHFCQRVVNRLIRRPWQEAHYINAVISALGMGFTLIDYSAAYGDGSLIGKAIRKSGKRRDELFLTTRVSNRAQFSGNIEEEFYRQLKNFGTNYVDILMFHWPVTGHYEATWQKMLEIYHKGDCRMLGVANCHAHHLATLEKISDTMPVIDQFEVHPLFTQKELLRYCSEKGIQVEAYTPIARFDDRLMGFPLLKGLALKYGKTVPQIVLRWHIQCGVIPVVRALSAKHQWENYDVFDFVLEEGEIAQIDAININARIRYDPDNCDFTML